MGKNVWCWGKKAGKWFWKLRVGRRLSTVAECGKKIAARLSRIVSRRLAAVRMQLRRLRAWRRLWTSSIASCRWSRAIAGALFSTIVAARLSCASANTITYNIVDYPVNEGVSTGSGTDTISGTIITDGTLGPLSAADIISGTLSFTDPQDDPYYAGPALFGTPVDLEATPTQLLLDPGADSYLSIYSLQAVGGSTLTADAVYGNNPGDGYYYGEVEFNSGSLGGAGYLFESYPVPTSPGSIGANSSWVIATVPEPTSLALFSLAILGIGIVYLRSSFIGKTTTRKRIARSGHQPRSRGCESLETRALLTVALPADTCNPNGGTGNDVALIPV